MNDDNVSQGTSEGTEGQCERCGRPTPDTPYCSVQCWASDGAWRDAQVAHWAGYQDGL